MHVPLVPHRAVEGGLYVSAVQVGTRVGYTGVGTGRGNTGSPSTLESGGSDSEAGPRKALQGPGVGWSLLQRPPYPRTHPGTARARSLRSLVLLRAPRANSRLLANKGENKVKTQ